MNHSHISTHKPPVGILALLLTLGVLAAGLLVPGQLPGIGTAAAQSLPANYDADGDGRIDVSSLAQLNAIRYDLNGDGQVDNSDNVAHYAAAFPVADGGSVCPSGANCDGYELTQNLNLAGSDYVAGAGWQPIGGVFNAIFEGNGHTISGLRINRSGNSVQDQGLFSQIGTGGRVRNLGLPDANFSGHMRRVGVLTGRSLGTVTRVFATGSLDGRNAASTAGGLIGFNSGTISLSYSTVSLSNVSGAGGSLVGWNNGTIGDAYATGSVEIVAGRGGGLTGGNNFGTIRRSYSTGEVQYGGTGSPTNDDELGGLNGFSSGGTISHSYYDAWTQTLTVLVDTERGKATHAMVTPTGYTGLFAEWNGGGNAWDFGTGRNYPALRVDFNGDGNATAAEFGSHQRNRADITPGKDVDLDQDGLIEVANLAQLNAIRWDLNGDGAADDSADKSAFLAAFDATGGLFCNSDCQGYELTRNLDFDANGDDTITSADHYWNGGQGWRTIGGQYTAVFDGNGHTISNLFIHNNGSNRGLFAHLRDGEIKRVGLVNVSLNASFGSGNNLGGLVANNEGAISDSFVTGRVGSGSVQVLGGLVGHNRGGGTITRCWVNATVVGHSSVGVLVGWNEGRISSTYATGESQSSSWGGGLVGAMWRQGGSAKPTLEHSYVAARVRSFGTRLYHGGLIGFNSASDNAVTMRASYFDSTVQSDIGVVGSGASSGVSGKTTVELVRPIRNTGIYAAWDATAWDFGQSNQYPVLKADFNGDGQATWQEFGQQTRSSNVAPVVQVARVAVASNPGADGTYAIGETIQVAVQFSGGVQVTGAPQLGLDFNGVGKTAEYAGTEGATITFQYTVAEGDTDANGIAIPANALNLNGGTIGGTSIATVDLSHDAVADRSAHKVDGIRPTFANAVVGTDGAQVIVNFTEPTGMPPLLAVVGESVGVETGLFLRAVLSVYVDDALLGRATAATTTGGGVNITPTQPIAQGQTVTVTYNNLYAKNAPGVLVDRAGNAMANFGPQTALNNSRELSSGTGPAAGGLWLSQDEFTFTEGESVSLSVRLTEQPADNVTVSIAPVPSTKVTVSPASLTFKPENWETPQSVTVNSSADDNRLGYWTSLRLTASGGGYEGFGVVRMVMVDGDAGSPP